MAGELAFIERLRAIATHPAARGLLDDAAVLEIGGEALVITHDTMVEGTHYLPGADMADTAWKLVVANLSDLAAKGAEPLGIILSHTLGNGDERFLEGLADALEHYGVPLIGGDTVKGEGPRHHGITALGRATHRPVPGRDGARIGDLLYVTGELGAAMMGFEALSEGGDGDPRAYLRPTARLAEGRALAPLATAMMDISDGLLLDSWRMAEASNVSLAIEGASVPLGAPEGRRFDAMRWGDDYELLFTLPPDTDPPVPATRIGQLEARSFVPLFLDGEPIANAAGLGFEHG